MAARTTRLLCVVCLLFSGVSQAEEPALDKLSLEDLLRVQVGAATHVASRRGLPPVSVTVISRQQIELAAARTLSELLHMYVPGYFLVEDQDDVIAGFRGFSPDNNSKVLLLLDGHPLNTEWFWGPADAVLNGMDLDFIDRVEVIRGPGSVILGQGALLGVVNVITRKAQADSAANVAFGSDGFRAASLGFAHSGADLETFVHVAGVNFDGEPMANTGWARDRFEQGQSVYERGHHLKRGDGRTVLANLSSGEFEFVTTYFDQVRDLYNFYRDREEVQQTLFSVVGRYATQLSKRAQFEARLSFDIDDFSLYSHAGVTVGGTREERQGLWARLNLERLPLNQRLALGVEVRRYDMGLHDRHNNNFIINREESRGDDVNADHTWVYPEDLVITSCFAEDFLPINERLELFGAFRFDDHPNWGNRFTPRLGALWEVQPGLNLRASFQSGFRGAVGVHYSGGFRQDGLLREDNFSRVEDNPVLAASGFSNLVPTEPEEMDSFELAGSFVDRDQSLSIDAVAFYNVMKNVIDVGVIWVDPEDQSITSEAIGSDVAGDWNGFWYFKNNRGKIRQLGAELTVRHRGPSVETTLSHSHVRVLDADDDQLGGSMYLAGDHDSPHFKAYPEDVTRLNIITHIGSRFDLSVDSLYAWRWISPLNTVGDGFQVLNLGARFGLSRRFSLSLYAKNLLDEDALYPMNNNAGDADLSAGTPALEGRSFWLKLNVRL